jgi:hypothetical protein
MVRFLYDNQRVLRRLLPRMTDCFRGLSRIVERGHTYVEDLQESIEQAKKDGGAADLRTAIRRLQLNKDYGCILKLAGVVRADPMPFLQGIWMSENPHERALRFDLYTYKGHVLGDLIENRPIGVSGNLVAFPLADESVIHPPDAQAVVTDTTIAQKLVSLPTRGIYAEIYLSRCATERRDVSRIIDKESRCLLEAPAITGIEPGGKRAEMEGLTPTQMAPPVVSIQNVPQAPAPTGLGATLELMKTADIFRDMSYAAQNIGAMTTMGTETIKATTQLASQLMDTAKQAIGGAAGGGVAGALGGAGAAAAGAAPSLPSAVSGAAAAAGVPTSVPGLDTVMNTTNAAMFRQTPASQINDQLQNIERAKKSGAITSEQAQTAAVNLLGGGVAGGGGGSSEEEG